MGKWKLRLVALLVGLRRCVADDYGGPCSVTAETASRIERWMMTGQPLDNDAFQTVSCVAVGAAGAAVGGIAGAAGGATLAGVVGEAAGKWFCGDGDSDSASCTERWKGGASIAGGFMGYFLGASVGEEAFTTFGRGLFFQETSANDAFTDCKHLFVLDDNDALDWPTVLASYKRLARDFHPDKKGGSNEAMAKLNVCREVLKYGLEARSGGGWGMEL